MLRVLHARHIEDLALGSLLVNPLGDGLKPSSPQQGRGRRALTLLARLELPHHDLSTSSIGPEDLIDFRSRDHFSSLGMPAIGTLIVCTIQAQDSFEASVAHPQSSDFPSQELIGALQDTLVQDSVSKPRLEASTKQDELLDAGIEMSVRPVLEEPFSKEVLHCSSVSFGIESSFSREALIAV
jgi:hypothetical protein